MMGYSGLFQDDKHKDFESELYVPFIVRWPGKVNASTADTKSFLERTRAVVERLGKLIYSLLASR